MGSQQTTLGFWLMLSTQMSQEVKRSALREGRKPSNQIRFLLELMLEISQLEPRFHIIPQTFETLSGLSVNFRVTLERRYAEYLQELAVRSELPMAGLARRLVQAGIELINQCSVPQKVLRKEELKKRFWMELMWRWSRIN